VADNVRVIVVVNSRRASYLIELHLVRAQGLLKVSNLVPCEPSNSTGDPGMTITFLESISTGFELPSTSALHFPANILLKPESCPFISGRSGCCIDFCRFRRRRETKTRAPAMIATPKKAPTPIPALAPTLSASGVRVGRVDEVGDVADRNGTFIAEARDVAYALGNSDRSLDCQYTDTGSAQTVPVENTVCDRTVVGLDTNLDTEPDPMLYA
jgi:hypothetical protein